MLLIAWAGWIFQLVCRILHKIAFMKRAKNTESKLPAPSKAIPEQERKVLLELGNDITRVRDKNDLIILFSKRIKGLFYFTHTLVALIDYKDETYAPFLLDNKSPIQSHPKYKELVQSRFSLNEPFIQSVLQADDPISFLLEDIMDQPQSPAFLRVNYEAGIREILMTRLMKEGKPMGFINIYSDIPGSFS